MSSYTIYITVYCQVFYLFLILNLNRVTQTLSDQRINMGCHVNERK